MRQPDWLKRFQRRDRRSLLCGVFLLLILVIVFLLNRDESPDSAVTDRDEIRRTNQVDSNSDGVKATGESKVVYARLTDDTIPIMLDSIGVTDKFTDAELHAFLQWSQQSDPTQKLRVLEVAFDNPDAALRLAQRSAFTMNACVGLSPERRSRVLAMLHEPPKMGSMNTVSELRGLASRLP